MENQAADEAAQSTTFGRRKMRPRVCVADAKQHIRTFLAEALEELGFITCECAHIGELGMVLEQYIPDLIVFGLASGGSGVEILRTLAARKFDGKILVFGPRDLPVTMAFRDLGAELGLAMLPILPTPFDDKSLRNSVAGLLPVEAPSPPPVDVAEALGAGWLELWYQLR